MVVGLCWVVWVLRVGLVVLRVLFKVGFDGVGNCEWFDVVVWLVGGICFVVVFCCWWVGVGVGFVGLGCVVLVCLGGGC